MKSTFWYWFFAVIVTLGAAFYQRITGPTYPKLIKYEVSGVNHKLHLPRSADSGADCQIILDGVSSDCEATLYYRHFPSKEDWIQLPFKSVESGNITSSLPTQPAAGKLEYYIEIKNINNPKILELSKDEPCVIRFKNSVPAWALIPHIILMFIAMLFSNLTGAMAIFNHDKLRYYGVLTLIILFIGGFIFGPIVQCYAFGQAWTGFPLGFDLTDNKTLIAFVAWGIAVLLNKNVKRPIISFLAAIVMIIVFSIPHSLRGSELNYNTGKIVTGFISTITSSIH
ncbi:MAG: hypothetical protein HXX16_14255 [Bacteroidales bacterium]|nr:hypothetical protein [Bacteroidales bacterium]